MAIVYLYDVFSRGSHLCNFIIFRIEFDCFFTFQIGVWCRSKRNVEIYFARRFFVFLTEVKITVIFILQ